jgi:hypothetical protein
MVGNGGRIPAMSLSLYRTHSRVPGKCAGGRQPDAQTYESDERRRAWKRCSCPIYASGTIGGQFRRGNTKRVVWVEAKVVAAGWESAGAWPTAVPKWPGGRVINELVETESPNRWRLSIECTDFTEPLRRTIAVAHVETQDSKISDVRYSHHEEYTRTAPYGIWRAPVHVVHGGSEQLKDELMRAAALVRSMAIHWRSPREAFCDSY